MASGLVVGAVIVDSFERPTRVLGARRSRPEGLAGRWEFPGGKVEAGEGRRVALIREVREELGVGLEVGEEIEGRLQPDSSIDTDLPDELDALPGHEGSR